MSERIRRLHDDRDVSSSATEHHRGSHDAPPHQPVYDVNDPTLRLGGGTPDAIFEALGHWADGEPWRAEADAMASALGLGTVDVRVGDEARAITEAHGARGVALQNVVYLHPERVAPGTADGREVLAHELVHLAQARPPADTGAGRRAAEREAVAIAPALARGQPIPALAHAIDLQHPAGDGDHAVLPDAPTRYGLH